MGRMTGNVAEKTAGHAGGILQEALKDAFAANDAHRANEDMQDAMDASKGKVHGTVYSAFETAGDAVVDAANVVTLGGVRHVGNVIEHVLHDDSSTIDYNALKKAKQSGTIDGNSKIGDRAAVMLNSQVKRVSAVGAQVQGKKSSKDKAKKVPEAVAEEMPEIQDQSETEDECDI